MHHDPEFGIREIDGVVEFVAAGPWRDTFAAHFLSSGAQRLVLNYVLGFSAPDLEFLRDLPVEALVVIDRSSRSLAPIHALSNQLKALDLVTPPDLLIDLEQLPNLQKLGADWRQVKDSIDRAQSIEHLFLLHYGERDLQPLAHLSRLQSLRFKDRPALRSLHGLAALRALTELGIFGAAHLEHIAEIESAEGLLKLELQSCRRIASIESLASCRRISSLNLSECGQIDSIRALGALSSLVDLQLYGTTKVVDGDLSPLQALPNLLELRMKSRKHYVPSVAQIQAGIGL